MKKLLKTITLCTLLFSFISNTDTISSMISEDYNYEIEILSNFPIENNKEH